MELQRHLLVHGIDVLGHRLHQARIPKNRIGRKNNQQACTPNPRPYNSKTLQPYKPRLIHGGVWGQAQESQCGAFLQALQVGIHRVAPFLYSADLRAKEAAFRYLNPELKP